MSLDNGSLKAAILEEDPESKPDVNYGFQDSEGEKNFRKIIYI